MSTAPNFLNVSKAKPHVVALAACLLLGGGLRLIGLTRGIGDFDPSKRSGQTHFYHFHSGDKRRCPRGEEGAELMAIGRYRHVTADPYREIAALLI